VIHGEILLPLVREPIERERDVFQQIYYCVMGMGFKQTSQSTLVQIKDGILKLCQLTDSNVVTECWAH